MQAENVQKRTPPLALVLEDEALIAMDLEETLREAGFNVIVQQTNGAAEFWLQAHTPDVAVIDLALSDGPSTMAAQILVTRQVPFIVHSGDVEHSDKRDPVFASGSWIGKPCVHSELVTEARRLAYSRLRAGIAPS